MTNRCTAIFDIGKTNKKLVVFDHNYQPLHHEEIQLAQGNDEDGFECEQIDLLENWIFKTLDRLFTAYKMPITHLNFSTYGASLIHLSEKDEVLTPLYNYLKSVDEDYIEQWYADYGNGLDLDELLGSPRAGFLNSGMQLLWLSKTKPELFERIRWSLHLPQYLSFLIHGFKYAEYSSVGCHTALWDYRTRDYHYWVEKEKLLSKFPPLIEGSNSFKVQYKNHELQVGTGIHDSSASLLPYIQCADEKFILISTGTWVVVFFPFEDEHQMIKHPLKYLQIDSNQTQAIRLLIGKEYEYQLEKISQKFEVETTALHELPLEKSRLKQMQTNTYFEFKHLDNNTDKDKVELSSPIQAIHQLNFELCEKLVQAMKIEPNSNMTIYIEGGFTKNKFFLTSLQKCLPKAKILTASQALGTALGAALVLDESSRINFDFRANYKLIEYLND